MRASLYKKLTENIEEWSEIGDLVLIKSSIIITYLPKFILSFYLYFNGRERESFSMSLPMM